jgi:hypothetical protein
VRDVASQAANVCPDGLVYVLVERRQEEHAGRKIVSNF